MSISIFISYSTDDKGKMLSLQRRIKAHSLLKAIVVADDRRASKLLTDKVKEGIRDCDYFVCILTSKSIKNQWVNQEIGYATALGKPMRPIVESGVLNKLKGFIHKQMDLPYSVKTTGVSPRAHGILFSKRAKVLVDDILLDNSILPKHTTAENFFPGLWESEYVVNGQHGHDRRVEVKNENEYHTNGKLAFLLKDLSVDLKKGTMGFIKFSPDGKTQIATNELRIVKLHGRYEGKEAGSIPISYYRLDG